MARHDSQLKSQLESPRLKNATYVSPGIIVNVIGKGMIQESILGEVATEGYFFSIMKLVLLTKKMCHCVSGM